MSLRAIEGGQVSVQASIHEPIDAGTSYSSVLVGVGGKYSMKVSQKYCKCGLRLEY